ncbi:MAG: hypothetical protein HDT37_05490 [Clostridiales bacterium]|nr:hypothetical protein [Clostridiales bacterium]
MGTSSKNTAKTATVMNLISRRPQPKAPAIGNVSDSDTTDSLPAAREQIEYIDIDRIDDDPRNFYELLMFTEDDQVFYIAMKVVKAV